MANSPEGSHNPEVSFLLADADYLLGQIVVDLGEVETVEADARRLQVTARRFILPPQIYHSCHPNAYIDWTLMKLRALRPIAKDTLVTYHYGTSELDYEVGAFQCECGAGDTCVGFFRGFSRMQHEAQEAILEYTSPYIRSVWDQGKNTR